MKSNINKEQTIVLLKEIKKLKEELKLQDKTIFSVLDMVLTSSHPNTFKPIIDFLFEKNYISRGQLAYFEKVNEISAKASFEEILIDTIPEGKELFDYYYIEYLNEVNNYAFVDVEQAIEYAARYIDTYYGKSINIMDVKKEPLTKEDYSTLQKIETNLNKQRVLFLENHEILKIEEYLECLSELLEKDELSLTIISNIKNIIK